MKSKLIIFSFITVLLNYHDSVAAVECVVPPVCSDLGFTQDYNQCYKGDGTIECPTNTGNHGTDKYYCGKCKFHYKLSDGNCVAADNCAIEDIFSTQHELYSGKKLTYKFSGDNIPEVIEAAQNYAPDGVTSDEFGAGTWYLPAIGEYMEAWGFSEMCNIRYGLGNSGAATDSLLKSILSSNSYWTITEYSCNEDDYTDDEVYQYTLDDVVWVFNASDGSRGLDKKGQNKKVRYFNLLENAFCPKDNKDGETSDDDRIKVGDYVFDVTTDAEGIKTIPYSTSSTLDGKSAIGRVVWVSESGQSAKIISLSEDSTTWGQEDNQSNIKNYSPDELKHAFLQDIGECVNYCPNNEDISDWKRPIDQGEENTKNMKEKLSSSAVAEAALNYTPIQKLAKDEYVGKGTWYVPSISEWVGTLGFDTGIYAEAVCSGTGATIDSDIGSSDTTALQKIQNGLNKKLSGNYWSSTEDKDNAQRVWGVYVDNNTYQRKFFSKTASGNVRFFNYLKDVFCSSDNKELLAVGNIVYSDGTSLNIAEDIESVPEGGTAVGIIVWAGEQSAKIMSLSDNNSALAWASTLNENGETNSINVNEFEALYTSCTAGGVDSCKDVKFELWGMELAGTNKNERYCTGDNIKTVLFNDGTWGECYHPRCECKSNETFVHGGKDSDPFCTPEAYESCKAYKPGYPIDDKNRDIGCYPWIDENFNQCGGDDCRSKRVIANELDYQEIWLTTGMATICYQEKEYVSDKNGHAINYGGKDDEYAKFCEVVGGKERVVDGKLRYLVGSVVLNQMNDKIYTSENGYAIYVAESSKIAGCRGNDYYRRAKCLYTTDKSKSPYY